MNGWIKLHRKFTEWEWYQNSKMVHLFIHLLVTANHTDKTWQGIHIKRGQLLTGIKSLNKDTKISIQSLRTCLSKLKITQEITIKPTNKYSIITICNYEDYQSIIDEANNQTNKQLTNKQQTTNKQLTTTKKVKKEKNDNNEKNIPFDNFWNLYSKKVNKKDSEKKWNNLKDEDRTKIITTLPEWLKQFSDSQFIPHPTTYFNQRRWEDEITPNVKTSLLTPEERKQLNSPY